MPETEPVPAPTTSRTVSTTPRRTCARKRRTSKSERRTTSRTRSTASRRRWRGSDLVKDLASIQAILDGVKFSLFPDWQLHLRDDGGRPYLQVHNPNGKDATTGDEMPWSGRKWMLSHHM